MLPPVLEIYVVHHPDDHEGAEVGHKIFAHFHGTAFSGLIGGAIEVYIRSEGWQDARGVPRPITLPGEAALNGVLPARLVAVVPVLSLQLARAVQRESSWATYIERIVSAQAAQPDGVGIFPLSIHSSGGGGSRLAEMLGAYQGLAAPSGLAAPEPPGELICRDLAQGIAQMIAGPASRLQIFISHTRRTGVGEEDAVPTLIRLVREIIGETRLRHFFDANDLQPGRNWDEELRHQAASGALLALRTDLYASRAWCQREMLICKRAGMPAVILDCLAQGEERGSFLMDHLPRIPVRESGGTWRKDDIRRGLNLLVDECLKRAVWSVQRQLAASLRDISIAWWAPHAPEPVTLAQWMEDNTGRERSLLGDGPVRILHPEPPLGPDEREVLLQMATLMGHYGTLDVMTPRALAARGTQNMLPPNTLSRVRVSVSASPSPDLARLGLLEDHFRLALGEITRTVLVLGGRLQYCGHLDHNGYTTFLVEELKRYGRNDEPLSVLLAWSVHRRLSLRDLGRSQHDLGLAGSLKCLDVTGAAVDFASGRQDDPPGVPRNQVAKSLTAMRRAAILEAEGRVLIGGRKADYEGVMPGILEEALLALEASKPVFLAGGFGGLTLDLVRRVQTAAADWLPAGPGDVADHQSQRGFDELVGVVGDRGWKALANGLDEDENRQLAATHRPSEIAALVSLGLGRLAQAGTFLPENITSI
jgi:hypothetical protein